MIYDSSRPRNNGAKLEHTSKQAHSYSTRLVYIIAVIQGWNGLPSLVGQCSPIGSFKSLISCDLFHQNVQ